MPKISTQSKKLAVKSIPLVVLSQIWGTRIEFTDRAGKVQSVQFYEQARHYAETHGYSGIKIQYI